MPTPGELVRLDSDITWLPQASVQIVLRRPCKAPGFRAGLQHLHLSESGTCFRLTSAILWGAWAALQLQHARQ